MKETQQSEAVMIRDSNSKQLSTQQIEEMQELKNLEPRRLIKLVFLQSTQKLRDKRSWS